MNSETVKYYTLAEIAEHNNPEKGYWIAVKGEVFDITRYYKEHPGGDRVMLKLAGTDATKAFNRAHDGRDHYLSAMPDYTAIGLLKQ